MRGATDILLAIRNLSAPSDLITARVIKEERPLRYENRRTPALQKLRVGYRSRTRKPC